MSKAKELLKLLEKLEVSGKYIKFPGGGVSSIPSEKEFDKGVIVFDNPSGQELRAYQKINGKIYADFGKYDKEFKDLKSFVDYLNKNKFEFLGIDNI
jgi:hypothetical protein